MGTTDMENSFTEQCGGENFLKKISKRIYESALPVHVKKGGILIQKGEKTQYGAVALI